MPSGNFSPERLSASGALGSSPKRGAHVLPILQEGARLMQICNACRYCEGFCAVFPAMERRLTFTEQDLHYLANLCHDCGECYYSCQYAPPHEFAVNVPRTFAAIRRETYRKYAWPGIFAGLFDRSGLALLVGALMVPIVCLLVLRLFVDPLILFAPHSDATGSFYRVMPHTVMTGVFGTAGLLVVVAFIVGLMGFWRDTSSVVSGFSRTRADVFAGGAPGESSVSLLSLGSLGQAMSESFTLRYLDGGGEGCAYPSEVPSQTRRWFHHLTFYGFVLCFASTSVAAFYHNVLGRQAPYHWLSLPVVLGCLGGVGLLIGPVGLLWLKRVRDSELNDRAQTSLDVAFLVMLFLTSLTGFLLLVLRESAAMGMVLGVHLGVVLGLFLTLPYGKFVHGIYRFCALVRNAIEQGRVGGARLE